MPKPTDASGTPAWQAEYAAQVTEMLDAFESGGSSAGESARLLGGPPTLQDPQARTPASARGERGRTLGRRRSATRARYIDAYELFSGTGGDYTPTLPGEDGEPQSRPRR